MLAIYRLDLVDASLPQIRFITCEAELEDAVAQLGQIDPILQAIYLEVGLPPLRQLPLGFEGLAHVINSQMLSRASADAIWARLKARLPEVSPANYLALSHEDAKAIGLSRGKHNTLLNVANALIEGQFSLEMGEGESESNFATRLTSMKGIGPWTAQVYLLFAHGALDLFPAGDIALQEAARRAYHLEGRPSAKDMQLFAARWAPYRSVAARLLWAYYGFLLSKNNTPIA